MTSELILRYFHFVSIIVIAGTLTSEYVLLKKSLTRQEINRLARIDALYGIAALLLVGVGLTLWLGGIGKPTDYYSMNWIFLTKLSLFSSIGIMSLYPTVFFLKNRKGNPEEIVMIPSSIYWILRIEILLLLSIPLLAGLMARGIGYFGN
jgi:putative membrane protein